MHILIAGHLFPTPANPTLGVFVYERARALARRANVSVLSLVSYFPFLRPRLSWPRAVSMDGVSLHRAWYLALPHALFSWRWRVMAAALRRAVGDIPRPDIVHVDWVFPDACAIIRWARTQNIPSVITVHGRNALGSDLPKSREPLFSWPLGHCDRIITVSQDLKHQLHQRFPGIPPETVVVIPNGVDPARFKPIPRQQARQALGLPQNAKLIVNVARLSVEKAQDTLIRAAAQAKTRDLLVYLVGDGPLRSCLQNLITTLQLGDRVRLAGKADHDRIPLWMAAADVFCLPSLHEGCPVTILESLACGIPVVATRVGGIPEIINQSEYGILVPPADPCALAAALDQAFADKWNPAALSIYGQSFTWDKVANHTMAIYHELANPEKMKHS